MTKIEIFVIAIIVFILGYIVFTAVNMPPCLKSHQEIKHRPLSTVFINSNGILIPMTTGGDDYVATVCDEYDLKSN